MAIGFEKALGVHEQALHLRVQRTEILANNLVNADTPNFKARDIDFKSALQGQLQTTTRVRATHDKHIGVSDQMGFQPELKYRIPMQPSLDGNTVEEEGEISRFAKNNMDFQTSFMFLNGKFKGLTKALKGE